MLFELEARLDGGTLLNMVGRGVVSVREAAGWMKDHDGVFEVDPAKQPEHYEVNVERLSALLDVPATADTVQRFIRDVEEGTIALS